MLEVLRARPEWVGPFPRNSFQCVAFPRNSFPRRSFPRYFITAERCYCKFLSKANELRGSGLRGNGTHWITTRVNELRVNGLEPCTRKNEEGKRTGGVTVLKVNHRRRLTGCRGCQCTHRQRVDGCMHPEEKLSKTQLETFIHCGQLILRKISTIGATRCQILRLKCTKPRPRWGSLQCFPRPPSCIF